MSENTLQHLRNVLFETIAGLRSGDVKIETAKTISELSQVMINSAKVEVEFIKATGTKNSEFIASRMPSGELPALPAAAAPDQEPESTGVRIPGAVFPSPHAPASPAAKQPPAERRY